MDFDRNEQVFEKDGPENFIGGGAGGELSNQTIVHYLLQPHSWILVVSQKEFAFFNFSSIIILKSY